MQKTHKWFLLLLIAIAFITIGYLRDFIMVNVNYHLDFIKSQKSTSYAHSFFDFLNNFSFSQVYYGKYLLTLIFIFLNLGLSLALIKVLLKESGLLKIMVIIYSSVFVVAALFFLLGFVFNASEQGYIFSRELMGFLQSPVPCAILLFGYPLYRQVKST